MSSKKSHHVGASLGGTQEAEPHNHGHDYSGLLTGVRASFEAMTKGHAKVFMTGANVAYGLNEIYLDSLPSHRQVHNCHACRQFLERFGGLVTIDKEGGTSSVMFHGDVPEFYETAFHNLATRVENSEVTGVFASKDIIWGNPATGVWRHMAVSVPRTLRHEERVRTPYQFMAAKAEDFKNVERALSEPSMSKKNLDQAIAIFEGTAVDRASKFLEPLRWLRALHDRPKGRKGDNVLWLAIATAPEGFCHPRSSAIGPLLEDIDRGLSFRDIKTKFNAMVAPLAYQRPQAAPSAGNIAAAEALIEKLGYTESLKRRYALLEEILPAALWVPVKKRALPKGGVFAGLAPKADKNASTRMDLPAKKITWEKFQQTVLHTAERIEVLLGGLVPLRQRPVSMIAYTTATDPTAPPILKWDHADGRNPFSWYCYARGSAPSDWSLTPGWHPVVQVTTLPTTWGSRPMPEIFEGAVLMVEGARDKRSPGLGLFPEVLKGELHEVRSTIEAYSNKGRLTTPPGLLAIGVDLRKGQDFNVGVRVTKGGVVQDYTIDRWE